MRLGTEWARALNQLRSKHQPFMPILLPISEISEINAAITGQQTSPWLSLLPGWYFSFWVEAQVMVVWKVFRTLQTRGFSRSAVMKCAFRYHLYGRARSMDSGRLLTGLRVGKPEEVCTPRAGPSALVCGQANWGITIRAAGHSEDSRMLQKEAWPVQRMNRCRWRRLTITEESCARHSSGWLRKHWSTVSSLSGE